MTILIDVFWAFQPIFKLRVSRTIKFFHMYRASFNAVIDVQIFFLKPEIVFATFSKINTYFY